jgi:hypothetical protein
MRLSFTPPVVQTAADPKPKAPTFGFFIACCLFNIFLRFDQDNWWQDAFK